MELFQDLNLDFSQEIAKNKDLEKYINQAVADPKVFSQYENPLEKPEAPKLNTDFSNYFIMAGLPKVGQEKQPKLLDLLVKIFKKKGCDFIRIEDLEMPVQEDGISYGIIFAKVADSLRAQEAISTIHNHKLDKSSNIVASSFDDYPSFLEVDDHLQIPKSSDLVDLHNHFFDSNNDQFFVKTKNNLQVYKSLVQRSKQEGEESKEILMDLLRDK